MNTVLQWGNATHEGCVRARNEDRVFASSPVFVVADGMGGHAFGDVAATYATRAFERFANRPWVDVEEIVQAAQEANRAILEHARELPDERGMGTTITGLALTQQRGFPLLVVFNVGDSRCYRWHDGALAQVTRDHSYVQELLDAGRLTATEAMASPHRNVVTRALGMETSGEPDTWLVPVVGGDRFVLCSDGLTDEIRDADIAAVLAEVDGADPAAARLVEIALDLGARDNVSVVVVDVMAPSDAGAADADDETNPNWGTEVVEGDDTVPPSARMELA